MCFLKELFLKYIRINLKVKEKFINSKIMASSLKILSGKIFGFFRKRFKAVLRKHNTLHMPK